jgi:hypothetical protein
MVSKSTSCADRERFSCFPGAHAPSPLLTCALAGQPHAPGESPDKLASERAPALRGRPQCCTRGRAGSRRAGFTLVEYMIATSIGLLVLAGALLLWAFATRTCASLFGYVELSSTSKNALDRVSQQVRNAKEVLSCSPTQLVLLHDNDPPATGTITNTFAYLSGPQTLVWSNGATATTLLTDCTNFQFNVYTKAPISNSFGLNTNAWATSSAKVLQLEWTCVRHVTGDKKSVESQVSAKVVIRKKG